MSTNNSSISLTFQNDSDTNWTSHEVIRDNVSKVSNINGNKKVSRGTVNEDHDLHDTQTMGRRVTWSPSIQDKRSMNRYGTHRAITDNGKI